MYEIEIVRTEVDNIIGRVKVLEQKLKLNALKFYRECGLLIKESLIDQNKWNRNSIGEFMDKTGYSKATVYHMVKLGKMTELEFSNLLETTPNLRAWINKPKKLDVEVITDVLHNELDALPEEITTAKEDLEEPIEQEDVKPTLEQLIEQSKILWEEYKEYLKNQWKLAKLAFEVKTIYGEHKFMIWAEAIGANVKEANSWVEVYKLKDTIKIKEVISNEQ